MRTCEVLDLTKSGKVVYSLTLAVLVVQFGKSKAWFTRDVVEASRHLRQLRLDRLSSHTCGGQKMAPNVNVNE